jgi:hypothetical protein
MTMDEIRQRFPDLRVAASNDVGEQRATLYSFHAEQQSSAHRTDFTNVTSINLRFLDSVLISIEVAYSAAVRFADEQDFLTRVAEGLNLPNRWELMARQGQGVICRGFNVVATYNGGLLPQVRLFNTSSPETIFNRRREQEERRRQTFRP